MIRRTLLFLGVLLVTAACASSASRSATGGGAATGEGSYTGVSAFRGNVVYTISNASHNNLKAYRTGSWSLLGQWTIPALTGRSCTSVRGTDYDRGSLYIAAGGGGASCGRASKVVRWNLVRNKQVWAHRYSFGTDQLAACGGYIYDPGGYRSPSATWRILRESDGSVVGSVDGPTAGPHNTICRKGSAGHFHVYLGGRCFAGGCRRSYLAQVTCVRGRCKRGVKVGPGLGSGGVRPFVVGRRLSRVWETWTNYRGFSIGSLTTGKVLASVKFGSYASSDCGGISPPSHGISVNPGNTQVYVLDTPRSEVRVYSASDRPKLLAKIKIDPLCGRRESPTYCQYDCLREGWLQHTLDGKYVLVGDSGDIIRTSTRTLVVSSSTGNKQLHTDLANTRHGFIVVNWSRGVPVAGSHFGVGR